MSTNKVFEKLVVPNADQNTFRNSIKVIKDGEYEVEQLNDGKKILIKKPGYKGKNDFQVKTFDPVSDEEKSFTHEELFNDIREKFKKDNDNAKKCIEGLHKVCKGQEPGTVIQQLNIKTSVGLPVDTLLKNYKWIWGQEDCNYPKGKGRWLSMDCLLKEFNTDKK
ncbi:MAG: glutamyl-tRNA amidotransferase [Treponema sp.]|jgi:hypothetical protein|nr:glutamyl-tRNA amidotransferase [Treponema sp.]